VTDRARALFRGEAGRPHPAQHAARRRSRRPGWDWTIDCTFCAHESAGVDRYEPCLVVLLEGPTDRAVTIMDGPFPSLYPWDEAQGLCSLSSALHTPSQQEIRTWWEAQAALQDATRRRDRRAGRR
jgi:hypothetical protein